MTHELVVVIDDELEKEMSKYPEVNWIDIIPKLLKDCIRRKEISEMYTASVERVMPKEQ